MHNNVNLHQNAMLPDVLRHSPTRVVFGAGCLEKLGEIAAAEDATHAMLVSDPGIVAAGHVDRAVKHLKSAGVRVTVFDGVQENPTTDHVKAGVAVAEKARTRNDQFDLLIGLGGGSSMDCAKGINFLFTNGGEMADYWGVGKATKPMLPMIAIPTTAGTGSEAQSFALISDPKTHQKMACGDKKAACKIALLDPKLTRTQPPRVAAMTGFDALSHAVETAATTRRNDVSMELSREAWTRLGRAFEEAANNPSNGKAREDMLVGAHLAGAAIEHSMLGAAHAAANPLTARLGLAHGVAIALMLPHVVLFNSRNGDNPYAPIDDDPMRLAQRLLTLREVVGLSGLFEGYEVDNALIGDLAQEASEQWTARFNPVTVGVEDFEQLYRSALLES